ncbi:PTS transporter subunit EIIC [[Clostridium] innocuum]|nr:PTS transporter subunit EIIC [[Clostridium] innocuum]
MKKIMLWITDKFAPKMNKVVENPWVAAVAGSMMKGLPFILAGSLISFYNVFRSYVSALPDLGKVADFSFGFISIFLAFLVANQCMEKKKLSRYTIVAGLISIAVFVMFSMPEFNEQGEIILTFNRMGATGMLVAMLVGLFTGCIFNLYSKLHILENNVTIPDFVTEWINNLIPILCILLISTTIVFTIQFDIFDFILSLFSPLQNFGQTLPGFVLICLIPAVLYTLDVSNWLFYAASLPIFMAGIQGNIEAVAAGKEAVNIVTSETVFTAALITMGGMGATLPLNVMMMFSKAKKLKVMGRICIGPSIFNINEPLVFGAPIAFNPIMMVPFWLTSIAGPVIIWFSMRLDLLNIPYRMIQIGQIPAPFSSVMITEDMRAVIVYIILFAVYYIIWLPFFKVYEVQCLNEGE